MNKTLLLLAILLSIGTAAQAQVPGSNAGSTSLAESTVIFPETPANTRARIETKGNVAAQAGTVFATPPAAETCAMAGSGGSLQVLGGGFTASIGGSASESCEVRTDAVNLKATGMPDAVVKARQCASLAMAEAFEDAAMPCPERLRPQNRVQLAQQKRSGGTEAQAYPSR